MARENRRRERSIRAAVVVAERQGYYGSGGMGGGGGLQATDLRRRLESRCSGSTFPQSPRSLRHDADSRAEGIAADQEERVDLQATLASGQPTCAGSSRTCRRQDEKKDTARCSSGVIGSLYGKLRLSVGRLVAAEDEDAFDGKRHRFRRWCRRDLRWIADVATRTLLLSIVLFVTPGTFPF